MEFEKLFLQSKGQPITYKGKELKMVDRMNLSSNSVIMQICFLSTDSNWKQGIVLQTKGVFEINDQKIHAKIVLWEDTAPKELQLSINSKDKIIIIYNVWRTDDGTTHYWHNGGAMHIIEDNNLRRYNCNDGYPDEDFDDLIFTIQIQ